MGAVQRDRNRPGVRERILAAAFELYSTKGIRSTGIDELLARAEAAKSSFYQHFASKDELGLAYLERLYQERREELASAVDGAGDGPMALLAVFDVFEELFRTRLPETRSFVHVLMELGSGHPLGKACIHYFGLLRADLSRLAASRGIPDPDGFAAELQYLIQAAMVAAEEGNPAAAGTGRRLARMAAEQHMSEAGGTARGPV